MAKIKILVVDDSAFFRQSIAEILRTHSKFDVIGTAPNGSEAIRFISKTLPDVITLDLEMPTMDGFTFLRWLMAAHSIPVVVISSHSEGQDVLKALELGAFDFAVKPSDRASMDFMKLKAELIAKVETAAAIPSGQYHAKHAARLRAGVAAQPLLTGPPASFPVPPPDAPKVVAIGASTGGPPAVQTIITQLPKYFPAAVVVAQHMPPGFTLHFAERLNKASSVPVREATAGARLEPGSVYISPGGHHMLFRKVTNGAEIVLKPRIESDKHSPSVDQMMVSISDLYGSQVLGVILTGMGSDGKIGIRTIKNKGGTTIAESEETCVVFGMPKEAIETGSVDAILPLDKIPGEILRRCLSP
ncbi:MAG TPA: chemotaxis response regulator protein-glutamate methylesterase [Nitrospiria bacterium]